MPNTEAFPGENRLSYLIDGHNLIPKVQRFKFARHR
jgi:hypothetical protein